MLALRVIVVIAGLVVATQVALAQLSPKQRLTVSDRELDALCRRVSDRGALGGEALKAQIRAAWLGRMALLAGLPAPEKTTALARSERFRQCVKTVQADLRYPSTANNTAANDSGTKRAKTSVRRHFRAQSAPPPRVGSAAPPNTVRSATAEMRSAVSGGSAPPIAAERDIFHQAIAPPAVPQTRAVPPIAAGAAAGPSLQEFFPWPPPTPTDRRLLRLSQLGGGELRTWGDVADRLIALFTAAHYPSWGFYAAPGGFAVIPRVEQLDETGKPVAGPGRFATDVQLASLGFFQRITAVRLPQGLFRAFVFVLTTDPRTSGEVTDPQRMLQIAQRWGTSGALDLPPALRSQPIQAQQDLFLILYEFESQVGGRTSLRMWPLPDTIQQLDDAGIGLQP